MGTTRAPELQQSLDKWNWKACITKMPESIKELDLSTKDGLMRAIQIQQAIERKRAAYRYAEKYYSEYPSVKISEIEKADKAYTEDLADPQMVCNEVVANAILERNHKVLIDLFVNGLFKACEKVFGMATGVKVSRLNKAKKEAALVEWGTVH